MKRTALRVLMCILIASSSAGIGLSSWIISSTGNVTNQTGLTQDKDRICSVTTHVRSYVGNGSTSETSSEWIVISQNNNEITNDSGNIFTHRQQHKVGDVLEGPNIISTTYSTDEEGNSIIVNVYQRKTVWKVGDESTGFLYKRWWHKEQTEQQTQTITIDRGDYEDIVLENKVDVLYGSVLTPYALSIPDAESYGFYTDSTLSEFFDFRTPITSDIDLYAVAIKTSSTLTGLINSGQSVSIYDSTTGGTAGSAANSYNIFEDLTYDFNNKSVFLDETRISSGQTVSLTYGNGEVYQSTTSGMISDDEYGQNRGTDDSMALDYQKTSYIDSGKSNTSVRLFGDMVVRGTLNVGGRIGASNSSASGLQSFLFDMYATLDLFGHDLIVDGGTLNGYGLITDSVGTGKIIVQNGGTIVSTLTIEDARGRDQIILGYTKGQSPFTDYKFPYLRVPVKVMNGCTFRGSFKLDMATFGIGVINLDFIGLDDGGNNDFFLWSNNNQSEYVWFEPVFDDFGTSYPVDDPSKQGSNAVYRQMYYLRNRFEIFADLRVPSSIVGSFSVVTSLASLDADIDLVRVNVPISPFFDVVLKSGYTLDVSSKLELYPGASFQTEKGSVLHFSYRGLVNYDQIGNFLFSLPGESKYISGGLLAYGNSFDKWNSYTISEAKMNYGVHANSSFGNEYPSARASISGDLSFDGGNPDFYEISGPIDISSDGIEVIQNPANRVKTYALKGELTSGFCFHKDYHSTEESYEKAAYFTCLPLISLGKAYVYDGTNSLTGTFDLENGVFSSDGSNYILLADTDLYTDGSGSSDQYSAIDRTLTLEKVNTIGGGKMTKIESTYYCYFSGLHVPVISSIDDASASTATQISANCRKFFSNSELPSGIESAVGGAANYKKYDSVELTYSSSFPHWRYKSFSS